jgi:hypothetical protein
MKKLSGWKRIGIVASVAWAVGSFLWSESHDNNGFIRQLYDSRARCMSHPDHTLTKDQCDTEYMEIINRAVQNRREEAVIFALVPIPFGWIIIGGLLGVVRWVRAGFVS